MKVKLDLKKRIVAFNLLNNTDKASLADWKIVNQAKLVLGLSEEDFKEFELKQQDNGMVTWHPEKGAEEREYDIPKRAYDILEKDLQDKDKKGTLKADEADLAVKVLEVEE
tara:strand:+ start:193 stop:525 length:333 start_codon:yes stop_codon:yes gene_type:complete